MRLTAVIDVGAPEWLCIGFGLIMNLISPE